MLAFLLDLQERRTKYSCFLQLRGHRADHYKREHCSPRVELRPGILNVLKPRKDSDKVLLPSLHIKLGLVNQFVNALNFIEKAFQEIRLMFPKLSEAEIKGGIFIEP
ncbi:hypothetical protein FHG87_012378 [Trinorchestia longiramus]|nr:hypothetical protein FHG87_012378 [Trinorchestia longiramus]